MTTPPKNSESLTLRLAKIRTFWTKGKSRVTFRMIGYTREKLFADYCMIFYAVYMPSKDITHSNLPSASIHKFWKCTLDHSKPDHRPPSQLGGPSVLATSRLAADAEMFAGASNFEIRNSILTTGNVTYHGAPQAANYGHVSISVSNVLQCPSPSQYFVGREDILEKLSKIFSAPVVTVWSTHMDVLKDFVRQNLKYSSSIFLDASSSQTLDKSIAENITQVTSGNTLLVLQNPSAPVEEYLDRLPYAPVLAITTESSVESSTAFQFPDYAIQQVNQLLHSIENAFDPGQRVVTLIANGGTGKTQTVLHFVSKNSSRYSNVWFFDASSHDTLTANFKELGKAAGISEDVKNVRDFLARMHQNWLCIFDNADDETVFLKDYIPICNHAVSQRHHKWHLLVVKLT
ncbi:hypothetical protein BT96DRAFT_972319 [Gymnopus androsaceus JB14]|uniref:NB-ARC domain-containing protein n=1 Tax=Gymnopus androsaceus JB14 TaxID=1447944 RepID=A0A6A4IAT8_9AGAR|nr:hypothetical protein BT96DRAFT_972319 [Gymnopus androsaceus JB14]